MVFLKVLKAIKKKEKEMRLLLLGLDNAGKTTIVKRLNGDSIEEVSPTLGFTIKTLLHNGFQLNIWDVGGQKTIRAFWRNYFEETNGLIWVIDSADISRLPDCRTELYKLLKEEKLAGSSLLILANKIDLTGATALSNLKEYLELDKIKTHHWNICACSAVTGEGLLDGFNWLVQDIAEHIQL